MQTFFAQQNKDDLPNVLIYTGQVVSTTHGTGNAILRNFRGYPREKLFNVYYIDRGEPALPSLQWSHESHKQFVRTKDYRVVIPPRGIRNRIEDLGFKPNMIYSTFYGVFGCRIVQRIIEEYDYNLPVIQHALDVSVPHNDFKLFAPALEEISPLIDEFWALTPSLAADYEAAIGRDVKVVNVFSDLPYPTHKTAHRDFTEDFRAIITGNIWNEPLIPDIIAAWCEMQARIPNLPPIQWYGHPVSLANHLEKYVFHQSNPAIEYKGFPSRERFYQILVEADIALLPFNRFEHPESHYAKYSLPSRLTETLHAGLPVFAIAGLGTDTGKYVSEHKFGVVATPTDQENFLAKLHEFILDRDLRASCGQKALEMARTAYDANLYQTFLLESFQNVIQTSQPKKPRPIADLAEEDEQKGAVAPPPFSDHSQSSSPSYQYQFWQSTQKMRDLTYRFEQVQKRSERVIANNRILRAIPPLGYLYKLFARIRDLGLVWAILNDLWQTQIQTLDLLLNTQRELLTTDENLAKNSNDMMRSIQRIQNMVRAYKYRQKYRAVILLALPRSGSNLLKLALSKTELMGDFKEYFNIQHMHDHFRTVVQNPIPEQANETWQEQITPAMFRDYLEKCIEDYSSSYHVFGTKMHRAYMRIVEGLVDLREEEDFYDIIEPYFNEIHFVLITRQDKIRQAISLARARQDGIWASNQARKAVPGSYQYQYENILDELKNILRDERELEDFLEKHNLKPIRIIYEEFINDYERVVQQVIETLQLPVDEISIPPPQLEKQANAINEEWEQKFREDAAQWLTPEAEQALRDGQVPSTFPIKMRPNIR